jgi:uncharacterized damage-inducible protein DinB
MDTRLATAVSAALVKELEELRGSLRQAVAALDEKAFWAKPIEPGNSIGHLILHLTGNLNHFVGAQLGGTGYFRDREREFTEQEVPAKAEALARLDEAVATFRRVVTGLPEERLLSSHPEARFGSVLETLVHLVAHFAVHRGQVSYLVRLVSPRGMSG